MVRSRIRWIQAVLCTAGILPASTTIKQDRQDRIRWIQAVLCTAGILPASETIKQDRQDRIRLIQAVLCTAGILPASETIEQRSSGIAAAGFRLQLTIGRCMMELL